MVVPTIHLNGTSKQSLLEDLEAAYLTLDEAYRKLKRTAPNGRDYYMQGQDTIQKATDEHLGRLRKVNDVIGEIQQLMIEIDRQ